VIWVGREGWRNEEREEEKEEEDGSGHGGDGLEDWRENPTQ
jgi:hypothetical protein